MRSFEQDMIVRQIRQLGDMVAAVVARARVDADYASGWGAAARPPRSGRARRVAKRRRGG